MRYKIVTEENGLGELSFVPMYLESKVWYPFMDAMKKVKRFITLDTAKVFIDNQNKKRLRNHYEAIDELNYIPGADNGIV